MVFESLVVELLNKVLGDTIENLDPSQLNLGIFGGDVVLKDLNVKETALDKLDLPVRLKFGYLDLLKLKIPWKNLYNEAVEVTVDGLYVLVVPNIGIKYDAKKEAGYEQDAKQKQLTQIEEVRLSRRQKKSDDNAEAQQDSFVEKLTAQIIRNLQITIKNIHVRYEDEFTNRSRPFAVGATLKSLYFQTTDETWQPCLLTEATERIFKLINFDSISFYWNSSCELLSHLPGQSESDIGQPNAAARKSMRDQIVGSDSTVKGHKYLLQPLSVAAQLKLLTKPERSKPAFSLPKIDVDVQIVKIGLHINKYQYQDIISFLDALDMLKLNAKYRKYRPKEASKYRGNYKAWWHFAQTCILEDEVRRRHRNWSWKHMQRHRQLVRDYADAWLVKRTHTKPAASVLKTVETIEKQLDVFNLNVGRQQAELEIDRRGLTRVEDQSQTWGAWASSWFGGGGGGGSAGNTTEQSKDGGLTNKFAAAMNEDEKKKLYDALDYAENAAVADLPADYVAIVAKVLLKTFTLSVIDVNPKGVPLDVLEFALDSTSVDLCMRPAANAMRLQLDMQRFSGVGCVDPETPKAGRPNMLRMHTEKQNVSLLSLFVETNPLDGSCDTDISLKTQPINIIYDATSINKLTEVFRPPEHVELKRLTATAMAKYDNVKELTTAGLEHALEKRSVMRLSLDLQPALVLVPQTGRYIETNSPNSLLILELGHLQMKTVESKAQKGATRFQELESQAYDKFILKLDSIQILFAGPGEDWNKVRQQKSSDLHLLRPTGFELDFYRCAISDPSLASFRVRAVFPDTTIHLSDRSLLRLSELAASIPTPPPAPQPETKIALPTTQQTFAQRATLAAIMEVDDVDVTDTDALEEQKQVEERKKAAGAPSATVLELSVELQSLSINIVNLDSGRGQKSTGAYRCGITGLSVGLSQRSYDMEANVGLKDIEFLCGNLGKEGDFEQSLYIVHALRSSANAEKLVTVQFAQCSDENPAFSKQFENTLMKLTATIAPIEVNLLQEPLADLHQLLMHISSAAAAAKPPPVAEQPGTERRLSRSLSQSVSSLAGSAAGGATKRARKKLQRARSTSGDRAEQQRSAVVKMKIVATLHEAMLIVGKIDDPYVVATTRGLNFDMTGIEESSKISLSLKELSIRDASAAAVYKQILTVDGDPVFRLIFTQYNRDQTQRSRMALQDVDIAVQAQLNQMRIVVLGAWINRLQQWVAPFSVPPEVTEAAGDRTAQLASSAATQAQAFYQQATRIRLDVTLAAPVFVVPVCSDSHEALLANLGVLLLQNKFIDLKATNSKVLAIADDLTITVSNLKLARVRITPGDAWTVGAECELLPSTTVSLTVLRNMSFDWHRSIPEVTVKATFPQIAMHLSQEDYAILLAVATHNFAEGVADEYEEVEDVEVNTAQQTKQKSRADSAPQTQSNKDAQDSMEVDVVVEPATPAPPTRDERVKFSFDLDGLSATLYMGTSNLSAGIAPRNMRNALARAEVRSINAAGLMYSDQSMNASFRIVDVNLHDLRPDLPATAVKLLMSRKAKETNLLDVQYDQTMKLDKNVSVALRQFYLCFNAEFIASVIAFTTPSADIAGVPAAPPTSPAKTPAKTAVVEGGTQKQTKPKAEREATTEATYEPFMEVNVSVEGPEILVIEDALDPDKIKALIAEFTANAHVFAQGNRSHITAAVSKFGISSSYFQESKRKQHHIPVLEPVDVNFLSTVQDPSTGQHVDLRVTQVVLRVTPAIIALLSRIGEHMSKQQEAIDQSTTQSASAPTADLTIFAPKPIKDCRFWFLKKSKAVEIAVTTAVDALEMDETKMPQKLVFTLERFFMTLEAGVGAKTIPLVLVELTMNAEANDWSSKLSSSASVSLEAAYYNERVSTWEPLLEPLERVTGGSTESLPSTTQSSFFHPWSLTLSMKQNSEFDVEDVDQALLPPLSAIAVTSTEMLQLTVTKTSLDVLQKLGQLFGNAAHATLPTMETGTWVDASMSVRNDSGFTISVRKPNGYKFVPTSKIQGDEVKLPSGEAVAVDIDVAGDLLAAAESQTHRYKADHSTVLQLRFPDFDNVVREVDVCKTEARYFGLPRQVAIAETKTTMQWSLVVETAASFSSKTVTFRSLLQVHNHLSVDIEVLYQLDNNLQSCGTVSAGSVFSLPAPVLFSPVCIISFRPVTQDDSYDACPGLPWKECKQGLNRIYSCAAASNGGDPFSLKVFAEDRSLRLENSSRTVENLHGCVLHLQPPLLLTNMLSVAMHVSSASSANHNIVMSEGDTHTLQSYEASRSIYKATLQIAQQTWTGDLKLSTGLTEFTPCTFVSDGARSSMGLMLRCTESMLGVRKVEIYCPFWLLNKTGASVKSKAEDINDEISIEPNANSATMLAFASKTPMEVKTARLSVSGSDWSNKVPLEVAGSGGRVDCKKGDNVKSLSVSIQPVASGLSKLVTLLPYYMVSNSSVVAVEFREHGISGAKWTQVEPKQCVPFWPSSADTNRMELVARYAGSKIETQVFPFSESDEFMAMFSDKSGGLAVSVNVGESAVEITLGDFVAGLATVLVVNHTKRFTIKFHQIDESATVELPIGKTRLYNWTSLTKKRELVWSCGDKKNVKNALLKAGLGNFCPASNATDVYWVSFLLGRQRALLFTDDLSVATQAHEAYECEQAEQELTISLQGIGVSLVDNINHAELSYISLTSSGIIWESKKNNKRYQAMSVKECQATEEAFTKYLAAKQNGKAVAPVTVEKMMIDFDRMTMEKPHRREIRRTYNAGLWLKYTKGAHDMSVHFKANRLQIDNQLTACVFPVVLAPTPLPKSVAADNAPKPFAELSMLIIYPEHSNVPQMKYFKVLVQEMELRADQGFISALSGMFLAEEQKPASDEKAQFVDELNSMTSAIQFHDSSAAASSGLTYYDFMHFSPLMIHLSFSQGGSDSSAASSGGSGGGISAPIPAIFTTLFKTVGVTVTEVQDVVFKLAYFERTSNLMTSSQLTSTVTDHYVKQLIKQFYVLVLGLDVIGNPFGLIRSLGEGVQDLFYEPFQGAIQGPGEFAEGVALGLRSLFGHTVGGAAGAVSRITGTLGKGIAALTMDEEYQRKRQEAINRRPRTFHEGVAESGKGLVMGLYDGVTGVFLKPAEGLQKEGAIGLFKGMGKGITGLVTRPVSGVIDFASGSLHAVKTVVEVDTDNRRIRPPRFLHFDGLVRPYVAMEAEGRAVLEQVSKGKYERTDAYVTHAKLIGKYIFLATNHRILLISKSDVFGSWTEDWALLWDELSGPPELMKQVQVYKSGKRKLFGLGGSSNEVDKVVVFPDSKTAETMQHTLNRLYQQLLRA